MIDTVYNQNKIPYFITYCALTILKSSIKKETQFDVLSCNPKNEIKKNFIPTMFILGDSDELVKFSRFKKMFDKCPAEKKKFRLEKDCMHADPRSESCYLNVFEFFGADVSNRMKLLENQKNETFKQSQKTMENLDEKKKKPNRELGRVKKVKVKIKKLNFIDSVMEDTKIFDENDKNINSKAKKNFSNSQSQNLSNFPLKKFISQDMISNYRKQKSVKGLVSCHIIPSSYRKSKTNVSK